MLELDEQIKAVARALDAAAPPVTADEVRRPGRRGRSWWSGAVRPLAAAVVALLVVGAGAVVWTQADDDDGTVLTPVAHGMDLDGHVGWMLDLINGEIEADADAVSARFSSSFLAVVPADQFESVIAALAPQAPWSPLREIERRADSVAVQLVGADGTQARLTIAVDGDQRVVSATVLPARACTQLLDPGTVTIEAAQQAQLDWVLDIINTDREITDDELAEHFTANVLDALPPDEARARITELRAAVAPITPRWYEGAPRDDHIDLLVGTRYGDEARLAMSFDIAGGFDLTVFTLLVQQPCVLEG